MHEMIVGGILGMDFMRRYGCDLLISKNSLKVNSENVTCFTKPGNSPDCHRIVVMKSILIPANSEVSVEGKAVAHISKDYGIIEGSENFVQKSCVVVAKVLVEASKGNFPVRLTNLSDNPAQCVRTQ